MSTNVSNQHPTLIRSVAHFRDVPPLYGKEFCFAGRSNVGKSSFISHALNCRNLAFASKRPGKTQVANFFKISNDMTWVDLPGYGFAQASHSEQHRWSHMMEEYCSERENLAGVVLLLDIRHPGLEIDRTAYQWFCSLRLPVLPVLTKCDKIPKAKRRHQEHLFCQAFGFSKPLIEYSTQLSGTRESFWSAFLVWSEGLVKE